MNAQLTTAADPTAAEILAWSRTTVEPALRNAVAQLPGSLRRVAKYHFGWCDSDGKPASGDNGKAIRPALALLCAQAVGGDPEAAVPAAVPDFRLSAGPAAERGGDPIARALPAAG